MRIIIPLLLALLAVGKTGLTQTTINHPATDETRNLDAGTYFYFDSGGENGDYSADENTTLTLCASNPDEIIRVLFSEVELELGPTDACLDFIDLSGDVNNNNGSYCSNSQQGDPSTPFAALEPGQMFESAPGGCLEFRFESDDTGQFAGWKAEVDVRGPAACTCSFSTGSTLICESFESYAPWELTPQTDRWRLKNASSGDGIVTTENSLSGSQSLRIENVTEKPEVGLLLGNRTQGRYRLSWNMYIDGGSQGAYGVHHAESLNHWAFQVKMVQGTGQLFVPNDKNQNPATGSFSYQPNAWTSIVHIIDMDADLAELWVNGQFVADWQFSLGDNEGGISDLLNQLGGIEFSSLVTYYLDELCVTQVSCPSGFCDDGDPCAVTVNGQLYDSQCAATCAGYTAGEWVELQETPRFSGDFSNSREWVDQGDDIMLSVIEGDTMLFVDISAIDTLDFRPGDIELTNYCPDGLEVQVDDRRPVGEDEACYVFDVVWRVLLDDNPVDSVTLEVNVECTEASSIDSLVYLTGMDTLQNGDTLRLADCPSVDTSSFDVFSSGCLGRVDITPDLQSRTWVGADPQSGDEPCFREHWRWQSSQCSIPGGVFEFYVEYRDDSPPGFLPPPDTSVSCIAELADTSLTGTLLSVSDSCGILNTSYIDDLSQFSDCSGMVLRTWTVSDSCGNTASAVQQISVQDTLAPTFTAPADISIDSLQKLDDLAVTGMVSNVQDNCGIRDTTYTDDRSGLTGCTGTVLRTWTVTDSCGNATSAVQQIQVPDTEPPVLTAPADVMVSCLDNIDDPELVGDLSGVSDNAGVADTTVMLDLSSFNNCTGDVRRIWTVTDSCGNSATAIQSITVRDSIAPTFVAPFQVTIECKEDLDNLDVTGQVLFVSDNCGIQDTTYRDSITQVSSCVLTVQRFWTVRDECGNKATKMQRIQVADTQAPTFNPPPEVQVNASQLQNLAVTGTVLNVVENCQVADTTYSDTVVREADCDSEGWIVRTWTVTDACGNFNLASQDIFYTLDIPEADAGSDKQISCQEPAVELDGSGSSLGGGYEYQWTTQTGNIVSGASSPLPIVNAPGSYTLLVRDTGNGCTSTDEVIVTQQNDLEPNVTSSTDVTCHSARNGSISIDPQGGNPPYTVSWSNGENTLNLSRLSAGQYTVTVTDEGNCQATTAVVISEPPALEASVEVTRGSSCISTNGTGRATLEVSGGIPSYTFDWDNGDTTQSASGLTTGSHMVTVRDANGCALTLNFTVGLEIPEVMMTPLPDLCEGDTPLTLSGGSPAGGTFLGTGVVNGRFDPALAGTGTHTVRYAYTAPNGCSDTASTRLTVNPLPVLSDMGFDPVCINQDSVILDFVQPAGGTYSGAGIRGGVLYPAESGAGSFPVLYNYRDPATGCSNNLATLVTVNPAAEVSFDMLASDTALCENELIELTASIRNGGPDPGFSWMINGQDQALDSSVLEMRLPPGQYTVTGSFTSSLTCVTARTVTDTLRITVDSVTIAVTAPDSDTVCTSQINYPLDGAMPAGGTFSGDFVRDSMFKPAEAGAGVYTLTYTVIDTVTACPVSERFDIAVEVCTDVSLPPSVEELNVYPNPAQHAFRVDFAGESAGPVLLELWDSQGRPVRRQMVQEGSSSWSAEVPVAGLPKGIYLLSTRGEDFQVWRKVVVQ